MRIKRPDHKNALSLVEAAEQDMAFTFTLPVNETSGATIVRNVYESFRKLGDALLIAKGIESEDHVAPINELSRLKVDVARPLNLLDNMRRLRININYYGYKPSVEEVENAVELARALFKPLVEGVKKTIAPRPIS